MAKELIISANVHEKKVAILEDGVVTEFYVERRDENQGVVGNLYKGRVMKVLPGMQSAFVEIGLERDAFLYVSDFTEFMEEEDEIDFREAGQDRVAVPAVPATPAAPAAPARPDDRSRRQDRPRPPLRPAPEPPREEDSRRRLEDAVEQLAEIADERVIPPPPSEEELSEPVTELAEADAASVEEFFVERVTDEPLEVAVEETRVSEVEATPVAVEAEPVEAEAVVEPPVTEEKPKRRSRRKPAEAKPAAAKPEKAEAKPGRKTARTETVKAEAESEAPEKGARSSARKSGSRSTAKKSTRRQRQEPEAASSSATDVDAFQRITDEDIALDAGDLLKDAIVQEKIIEQVHEAEYKTSSREVTPEPEWRVGSFRTQADESADFHRIVDEVGETPARHSHNANEQSGAADEAASTEIDEATVTPFRHISEALPDELRSRLQGAGDDEAAESPSADDKDSDAAVRDRGPRAEFAIRRGGRGRRRRPHPPSNAPAPVSEDGGAAAAEADAEEIESADVQVISEISPDVEMPSAETRPDEARLSDTRQSDTRQSDTRVSESRPPSSRPPTSRPQEGRYDRRHEGRRPDGPRSQPPGRRPERNAPPTISELLHEGQEILVQIAKEPIAKKGARITSHIALPGRLLVYMPTVNHVGVSRKIPSDAERVRLKRIVAGLRERENASGGFIARTACAGHSEQELHDDMRYLLRTWADVRKKTERSKAPALVHQDLDLVQRILRDQLSEEFSAIRIDNEIEYAHIVEFVNRVQPKLVKRVKLYTGAQPIFEKYAIQPEVDKAVRPRVWLKSGGYIVINQTEALVAIDVNTGKFVGKSDKLEDTITRTNLEAVKEIVRQIRLRDLGGIIVLDLIDMEERKNRQRVMAALQQELAHDRAPSKILSINDFGLVAITRKRVKQSLERTLCAPCPYCQGAGMVKSAQTMCFEILEQAKAMSKQVVNNNDVVLRVSRAVAEAFRTTEREVFEEVEAYFGAPVTLEADPNLHQEQFDFAML
jgi:Rne/Rng family ribonuclease